MPSKVKGGWMKHSIPTTPYFRVSIIGDIPSNERLKFLYYLFADDAVSAENQALRKMREAYPHCAVRSINVAVTNQPKSLIAKSK